MPKPIRWYPSLWIEGEGAQLEGALVSLFDAGCLGTEELTPSRQRAYFPPGSQIEHVCRELARRFPSLQCELAEPLAEQDWLRRWKQDLHGLALGEGFFVVPSWESVPSTPRRILRIDPQRAFGTGTHDTTRLCLELIEELAGEGVSMIDAGSGTGILAMAAAVLGCRPVVAIDSDPDAAACASANFRRNGLAQTVRLQVGSIAEAAPAPADLVVANLSYPLIRSHWDRLSGWLAPTGYAILSGLVDHQASELRGWLGSAFRVVQERTAGEWVAVWIERQ